VPHSRNGEFAQEKGLILDKGDLKFATLKVAKDIAF
jgi:hypothetical protein